MPLGKYYCDYCDKEFQDTPVARQRHLQSSSHIRAKSLWYNSLHSTSASTEDPSWISNVVKGVCNRFVKTGFCPRGDSCKYLHPSTNNFQSNNAVVTQATGIMKNVQLQMIPGNQLVAGSSLPGDVVRVSMGMSWGNVPPSLKPPPEGGYPPLPFVDWG